MKQRIPDPYAHMAEFRRCHVPFRVKKTLYTMDIISDYGTHYWLSPDSKFTKFELNFITAVKRAALKVADIPFVNSNEIKYFNMCNVYGKWFDCLEVDLTKAYWKHAERWLPVELYEKGLLMSKEARLCALGNLAKTTTWSEFDGYKYVENIRRDTEDTRMLFFAAAKEIGELMELVMSCCNRPLFFWVDAVFTRDRSDLGLIKMILEDRSHTFSSYNIEKIVSGIDKTYVYSKAHKKKKREFVKEKLTTNYYIEQFKESLYAEC